jgi:cytochrome P450 family 4
MGVELNAQAESDSYRLNIREIGEHLVHRLMRPWLYFDTICELFGYNARLNKHLKPTHDFIDRIIKQRRTVFKGSDLHQAIDSENM